MLYCVAHLLVYAFARVFLRLRVLGLEHVPSQGGAIIAANHMSYLDIPLLGCALNRRADYMGKSELFRNPVIGFFLRRLGGFPIRRGSIDRGAILEAVERLKAGRLLILYPEGKRGEGDILQEPRPGIGMVAARAGVPVVPALIEGTERILPKHSKRIRFHPVIVRFGPPLNPKAFAVQHESKLLYKKISQAVMIEIRKLKGESPNPQRIAVGIGKGGD